MKIGNVVIVKNDDKINKTVRGCMVVIKRIEDNSNNPKIIMEILEGELKGSVVHTYVNDKCLLPLKNKGQGN